MAKEQEKQKGVVDELIQFQKDSVNFFNKCTRPDYAEYMKIL